MPEDISTAYKDKLLHVLVRHFPDAKIYLFGSCAAGRSQQGSDIDIAVDAGHKLEFDQFADARIAIDDLNIPLMVDLVDLNRVPQPMKSNILKEEIIWKH